MNSSHTLCNAAGFTLPNGRKKDVKWLVSVGLMMAIVIILANTPLGMIQLPIIKATTVHIPVIIGAIVLGPTAGAILGATFGVCSLINNTMAPALLSFAFSPFMSTTGVAGGIKAVWISIGCRILLGIAAGWLWIAFEKFAAFLSKKKIPKTASYAVALPITGFAATFFHTLIVMGSIYVLFTKQYAEARNVAVTAVFGLIMGTVTASGIPEAIAAAVLVTPICLALFGLTKIDKKSKKHTVSAKPENATENSEEQK